jgi:hypothetical protein
VRKIGNLYPATLESIDAQGLSTTVTRAYNCGCSTSPDGYGIERALRVAP